MTHWGNLEGLIPLFVGTYAMLLAKGIVPRRPRDPVGVERWRQKYGGLMTLLGPASIIFGLLQLFGFT